MSITLTSGATTITLPADLYWADEVAWSPVLQTAERTITGAVILQTATRIGGRPITLQAPDESSCWAPRSDVEQLMAWAAVAGLQLTLTLRGTSRTVVLRHQDGAAVQARPIAHMSDVQPTDWYSIDTIQFMEL